MVEHNGLGRTIFYILMAPLSLFKRNFFVVYWFVFFILVLIFHQFSGVKNVRYVSSIEIPLIVLSVAGIVCLVNKFNNKIVVTLVSLTLGIFILQQVSYVYQKDYVEYEGLYRYFKHETNNFTEYKRLYVFGSVRSLKHYREMVPDVNMLLWRRDYEVMCPEFPSFDYFAFDKEELLKAPDNFMYRYVEANVDSFERVSEVSDMIVFKKKEPFTSKIECPLIAEK